MTNANTITDVTFRPAIEDGETRRYVIVGKGKMFADINVVAVYHDGTFIKNIRMSQRSWTRMIADNSEFITNN